ncbi:MAG: hypothetical protein JWN14_586 [Chthonomonadales bacterium]|nr:hypothetical protein [Chthonomonadales bacterium]
MKRNLRGFGKWVLLGTILLIPITMAWIVVSHPLPTGSSLAHSHRLPATQGVPNFVGSAQGYVWLDEKTVRQVNSVPVKTIDIKDTDVETGRVRKVASYPKGKETGYVADQLTHLSPDRKWILYSGFNVHTMMALTGKPFSIQIPLDTKLVLGQSITILQRAAWMPDSLHWLELSEDKSGNSVLLLHALDGKTAQRFVVPGAAQWRTLLGLTARGTALLEMNTANSGHTAHMKFLEVDLKTGQCMENAALNKVPSLQEAEMFTPTLSPHGDRIAWATRHNPDIVTNFARMFRHKPQTARYEIWSCRLDGSQVHCADRVECQGRDEVEMTNWLPDNKRISFAFRDTFYIVPAD